LPKNSLKMAFASANDQKPKYCQIVQFQAWNLIFNLYICEISKTFMKSILHGLKNILFEVEINMFLVLSITTILEYCSM